MQDCRVERFGDGERRLARTARDVEYRLAFDYRNVFDERVRQWHEHSANDVAIFVPVGRGFAPLAQEVGGL